MAAHSAPVVPAVAPLVLGWVAVMHGPHRLVRLVRALLLLPVRPVAPPRTVPIPRTLPRPPIILSSRCIVVCFVPTAAVALLAPGSRALLLLWPLIRIPPVPGTPLRVRLLVRPLALRRYRLIPCPAVGWWCIVGIRGGPVVLLPVRHVLWVVRLWLLLPRILGPPALLLHRRGGLLQRHWQCLLVEPLGPGLQDQEQGSPRRPRLQHQGVRGSLQQQRGSRACSGEECGGRRGGAVRREGLLVLVLVLRWRGRRGRGHHPGVEAEVLVQQRRGQRKVWGGDAKTGPGEGSREGLGREKQAGTWDTRSAERCCCSCQNQVAFVPDAPLVCTPSVLTRAVRASPLPHNALRPCSPSLPG